MPEKIMPWSRIMTYIALDDECGRCGCSTDGVVLW